VVVGSVNVDLVVTAPRLPGPGETVVGGRLVRAGGGKGANAAVAAARAGALVALVAAVGDDDFGRDAVRELTEAGVGVGDVVARRAGAPTGAALIVVGPDGDNQIAVAPGANDELEPGRVAAAVTRGRPRVCLVSLEVPPAAALAAATAARTASAALVVDPAPPDRLPLGLLDLAPTLTPNAAEAARLTGLADPREAALALARRTGAPALVTLGPAGCLVAIGGTARAIGAKDVRAVDSTGAGDAFAGCLAARLAGGADPWSAARFATAAASLSVRARGARAGLPSRAEVEAELRTGS
jgi:ribokinase